MPAFDLSRSDSRSCCEIMPLSAMKAAALAGPKLYIAALNTYALSSIAVVHYLGIAYKQDNGNYSQGIVNDFPEAPEASSTTLLP